MIPAKANLLRWRLHKILRIIKTMKVGIPITMERFFNLEETNETIYLLECCIAGYHKQLSCLLPIKSPDNLNLKSNHLGRGRENSS